jgi:DnaJ-class molecular chaperone
MNEITEAYIILSNPETRAFHDRFGVKPPDYMVSVAKARHGGRGAQ